MAAAQRLDAADGVMDGRFYGRPIVQQGGFAQGGFPGQGFPGQGFQGGFPGQGFQGGFPGQVGGFPGQFGQQAAAQRLDAADGVMDGRFHGRPIVQAGGPPVGQFGQGVPFGAGGFGGAPFAGGFGQSSAAASLDAADGVMDGRFHGRPIVQAGGPQFGQFGGAPFGGGVVQGASSYVQAPPIVTTQPMVGGFQGGFPGQFGGFQGGFGGQAAAQRLDAADGVIDGQYFGRPIVRQ